jgi:signal transduction histidine kinase
MWNTLLKMIFHDLDLAMSVSLKQCDDEVEVARKDASEARRTLELSLDKQAAEEEQRQVEHRTVVRLLTTWLTRTSALAQEMGTPLNVILGRTESLLEQRQDPTTQISLQSIVRQVARLMALRDELCALNHGFNSNPPASDHETVMKGPQAGS